MSQLRTRPEPGASVHADRRDASAAAAPRVWVTPASARGSSAWHGYTASPITQPVDIEST